MSTEEKPLHVVQLTAENVKRLHAVTVRPNGALVVIGGRNAQGKSSLLDSIEMALAGADAIPIEPVRHGARRARIIVDLGEIVVERTFSAKGTQLVVRDKDGNEKSSPQKLLNTLCARVAFDPLEFARMEPKKQDEVLRKLCPEADTSDLDAARAKVFDQRTELNREIKRLEARIDAMPIQAGVPKEPIDVKETAAELKRRHEANAKRAEASRQIDARREDLAGLDRAIGEKREQVKRLEADITAAMTERETMAASVLRAEQELPGEESTAELQAKLENAEGTNAKVRAAAERKAVDEELIAKTSEADLLTDTLMSLDEEKSGRLAKAQFPIAGLGFDETGPMFGGVPLAQASQAEQLRVSVAIGAALNPKVKVMLVREGSRLDDDGMRLLAELAEQTGSQVWVERVGTKDPSAVVIEDGEVLEPTVATTTAAE